MLVLSVVVLVVSKGGKVGLLHWRDVDLLVKKAQMLPHPAHSTSVIQNCTSLLNSSIAISLSDLDNLI